MSIHYKLFEGSHVNDIVMTSARKEPTSQGGLIAQLKETCKELETGIRVAKARKEALEVFIAWSKKGWIRLVKPRSQMPIPQVRGPILKINLVAVLNLMVKKMLLLQTKL